MAKKTEFSGRGSVMELPELRPPSNYRVIFFNDDYTTMEFVVDVLMKVFHKDRPDAVKIMESVHKTGRAVVGVYAYDIAATRRNMTINMARSEGFPLRCELEEA
ncbi:MAG: ATP-dependent Clp protease adaptor ClpS [Treponema sp.]|nr:ATP-dependent Clp protease adaptor ClpS [Treponema sp.]